jgi:hypothetical protein
MLCTIFDALFDLRTALPVEPDEGEYANIHIWIIQCGEAANQQQSDY